MKLNGKAIFCFLTLMLFAPDAMAQKVHYIRLIPDRMDFYDSQFYIDTVVDAREDKTSIGTVRMGLLNVKRKAQLESDFSTILNRYFATVLPQMLDKKPVTVVFRKFSVSEKASFTQEYGSVNIEVDFYYQNDSVYSSYQRVATRGTDVTGQHDESVVRALEMAIMDFKKVVTEKRIFERMSDYKEDIPASFSLKVPEQRKPEAEEAPIKENRNIFAVGYQIGGYTLIGFNAEVRILNYFGLHGGGGIRGYTAGVKIHTGPGKNSPFFNVSYKDGGFGLISTMGLEFGGRITFGSKGDFALHGQLGAAEILYIDKAFAEILFGDIPVPERMLSMGIGFSWPF
ncbi:MAG: hypothetical protein WD077_16305 [Bacteroidia bacterium]